ncbi:MAG TPA: PQQ-dependent sugar dehydrogenase [Thermoanaerobaculia bacterium]|nr:PQQ-dependent sugar dehydrogenase [Thermoanaerobaculia bacterium]
MKNGSSTSAAARIVSRGVRAAIGACLALALDAPAGATSFKQPGFSETVVFSGLTFPTVVRFLPDGRVLVAEKGGKLKLFPNIATNSYTVVADLSAEVHNFWDRGLLGLAVDPNFATNNYVYVLYSYNAPIGGIPPAWPGTSCPDPPGATTDGCVISGRLSRLTAVGADWTSSETPILDDWCQQFPSHSIGSLNFGADGYLYVSAGEGGNFNNADWGQWGGTDGSPPVTPRNPCGDPPAGVGGIQTPPTAEGGALRAQSHNRTAGEPRVLNGSLLRIDPATGLPAPDNPFINSADPNERRLVAYGLRNPFRFTIKPGTNDVWISDVGWNSWEEIDRVPNPTTARNFGWPCYEGTGSQFDYNSANLNICETLYAQNPPTVTPPYFTYYHGSVVVPGDGCPVGSSSIAGIAFTTGNGNYPTAYDGALFFSDYSRSCVWVMFPGAGGDPDPTLMSPFSSSTGGGPVELETGPDGNVYYVDYNGGKITRFVYGLNAIAVATTPTAGPTPLSVSFDGTGSIPAQPGDTLSYAWDLNGDGQFDDSASPTPTYQYTVGGTYDVRLKVTDQRGASAISAPIVVTAGNQPPVPSIAAPLPTLTYKVGDVVGFSGSATDPEDGILPPSALSWVIIIHHCPSNCHTHTYETLSGVASGTFIAPDHEYPSWLEIQLTATDSGGLQATTSVSIQPQTVTLQFQTAPPGLQLTVGTFAGPAPFPHTVVIGSANELNAPSPQGTYPTIWQWTSWSDGGSQDHTVIATPTPVTYLASFGSFADLSVGMTAPPEVCDGAPLTYTINVANAGLSRATSVSLVDALPAGATLVSASGDGWNCDGRAPLVCTRSTLDVTAAPPVTVVVTAPAGAAVTGVTVGSAVTDVNGGNNTATASTNVDAAPALPTITAANWVPVGATAVAASVPDDAGSTYAWALSGGTITTGQGTSAITYDAGSPGTTMALTVIETNSTSCPSPQAAEAIQVDFLDVPPAHLFHDYVDTMARVGVTAGCGGGNYCPDTANTRAQMAVFLLKAEHGSAYAPPPCAGLFADVPCPGGFAVDWIEQLALEGVTGGCGGGNFCPSAPVTRAQMAIFLLKTSLGSAHVPPPAVGIFGDVPQGAFAADWIEDLYGRGITGGCQASPLLYCPDNPNTRGQMAVFLTKTFSLQ